MRAVLALVVVSGLSAPLYAQQKLASSEQQPAPVGAAVGKPVGSPAPAAAEAGGPPLGPAQPPRPPRKFLIDGKLRVLRKGEIRPYVAPVLEPEPEAEPSDIKVIEVLEDEAQVLARPFYGAPMVGTLALGARLPIRGVFTARSPRYCANRRWLSLSPSGWLCSKQARPTDQPMSKEAVLQVPEGERLPFHYVMVSSKEPLPMWAGMNDVKDGNEPERMLMRGDTVAIARPWKFDGEGYYISAEGKVLPQKGTYFMAPPSEWKGVVIDEKTHLPFGWITPEKAKIYDMAEVGRQVVDALSRRTRVDILGEAEVGKKRYLRIRVTGTAGPVAPPVVPVAPPASPPLAAEKASAPAPAEPARWVLASEVNEVRKQPPAEGINPVGRWIDIDLGEQVLVAYKGDLPVYATLVSSGRAVPTPMGNYPMWAKVSAITMKNQAYDDKAYFVNKVPWALFFQAHNAVHGAYWHDRFGVSKSHGCANVAPLDARYLFEWMPPALPPGWSSIRPVDLHESVTVHVYNSQLKKPFRQDRPIGPPDRDDEADRLELAEKRRAESMPAVLPILNGQAPPLTSQGPGSAAAPPPH